MSERPRRAIAGANMAKLLMQEDKLDDFYKTAYGGFEEEGTDGDYCTTENEQSDIIDTDFDAPEDEDDGPVSADEDGEKRKRRKWEVSKPTKRAPIGGGEKKERKKQSAPPVILSVSRRSTTTVKSEISKIRRDHEAKNKVKRRVGVRGGR